MDFPSTSAGKESACNSGDPGLILGSRRSLGERTGYLLTPVFLGSDGKNPPAVWKSWGQSLGWEDPLEKATHSSILAQRLSWTEEPGGLQSTGLQRVGHD